MRPNLFNSQLNDEESEQAQLVAKYKKLGIYSIYQKLFVDLEEKMNNLKSQFLKEGVPEWKAEAAIEQAKKEGQIEIIRRVQEKYLEILDELEKNKKSVPVNSSSSLRPTT